MLWFHSLSFSCGRGSWYFLRLILEQKEVGCPAGEGRLRLARAPGQRSHPACCSRPHDAATSTQVKTKICNLSSHFLVILCTICDWDDRVIIIRELSYIHFKKAFLNQLQVFSSTFSVNIRKRIIKCCNIWSQYCIVYDANIWNEYIIQKKNIRTNEIIIEGAWEIFLTETYVIKE